MKERTILKDCGLSSDAALWYRLFDEIEELLCTMDLADIVQEGFPCEWSDKAGRCYQVYCRIVSQLSIEQANVRRGSKLISVRENFINKFLESKLCLVKALILIIGNAASYNAGFDNVCLTKLSKEIDDLRAERLRSTRYGMSKKNIKIKKNLPKTSDVSEDDIRRLQAEIRTNNRCVIQGLVSGCVLKTLRKNYKGKAVKRVWILKAGTKELMPLDIPTLKDRTLQTIISLGLDPVLETTSDLYSFGGRCFRSAHQAIAVIASKLSPLEKGKTSLSRDFKKVNLKLFKEFTGRKTKVRGSKILSKDKRSREYRWTYYIARENAAPR